MKPAPSSNEYGIEVPAAPQETNWSNNNKDQAFFFFFPPGGEGLLTQRGNKVFVGTQGFHAALVLVVPDP